MKFFLLVPIFFLTSELSAEYIEGFQVLEVIDGDTVVVSHPEVKEPAQVQYAFNQNPAYANLFNKAGWPALTFTTNK